MAMSQSESRRAAMKAFEESLSQLQNTLQSEAQSENSLPAPGCPSQTNNQPAAATKPSSPAKPEAKPETSRSSQFTLEDLEEAAQDIENYMRCRTQDC